MDRHTVYYPKDLSDDEVSFLGVMSLGLPPSRAAGSHTFRVDHCVAVVAGLRDGDRDQHLAGESVTPAFRDRLRATIGSLQEKGLVTESPPGAPAATGQFEPGLEIDLVDPDVQPAVIDRYLSQQCMEVLFNIPAVYPFLMERYTRSGEVWRRLREGGYAR